MLIENVGVRTVFTNTYPRLVNPVILKDPGPWKPSKFNKGHTIIVAGRLGCKLVGQRNMPYQILTILWRLLYGLIVVFGRNIASCIGLRRQKDISGEIALITGAASGLGNHMAFAFAKRNAVVVLLDINEEGNEMVAQSIRQLGFRAHAYRCDCSKREEIYRVARLVDEQVGPVTMLVNNAGISVRRRFLEIEDDQIQKTMDVNALAHLWVSTNHYVFNILTIISYLRQYSIY